MSYRLKKRKRVGDDVRRVVQEQLDEAAERLSVRNGDRDKAIHDARVCFKKIRAALRLMRDPLGGKFEEENIFYRDLGRRLSDVRNNVALLEAFAKLKERYGDELAPGALSAQRRPLAESNARQSREKGRAMAEVGRSLKAGRRRTANWPLPNKGFRSLAPGLKRTYREGRRQFAIACKRPTVTNLHEWRKRVKDLWYQLRLVKKVWPAEMKELAAEMEKLGDYLSDHHDLALLRETAADHAQKNKDESPEIETFLALIDQRRAELRVEARLLGKRLYAEKPSAFTARLNTYWDAWRAEPRSKPAAAHADEPSTAA
jgi:CHAD domain-containing protein